MGASLQHSCVYPEDYAPQTVEGLAGFMVLLLAILIWMFAISSTRSVSSQTTTKRAPISMVGLACDDSAAQDL
jgi:hypothetical protein